MRKRIQRSKRLTLLLLSGVFAGMALSGSARARAQEPCKADKAERDAAKKAGHPRPVESQLIFEDQGSFGNYMIFAQGEDSKLFTAGVEYDRHSWGCLLKAQVYYVAEFLPFVLLDESAVLNYYGISRSTNKQLVPGIGITPIGFRMMWRDGRAIKPYIMAKGGFLIFTKKAESPNASYENISLRSEIGLQIRMTRRVDLRLGMGDFHFSNAFVVPSNPGLDVMSYMGGIAWHLKE
jgi:Lipid A 3-O-deacylase (PagL)